MKRNKKEKLDFIQKACDEFSNLTEEQYQSEKKFFTSFDEELEKLSKNLSEKIKNGEINNDIDK